MGSVWRAEHLALGSQVAIKLIDPSIADSAEALARFKREAQASAELHSQHVVHITDYGVDDNVPFIAMELLEGESLAARLERVGRLPHQETAYILSQVAGGGAPPPPTTRALCTGT
jgi:serine/threonine-protein kinase